MTVNIRRGTWNISIRAQTPVGPWAFSLHVFAASRAEAEALSAGYLRGMLSPAVAFKIARAMFEFDYFEASGPRVYFVKASTGDAVRR